jgi:hypothetical protein
MPLTLANKIGNGSPAIEDLIAVQTAILTSNTAVVATVTEFRRGMDKRLDRQFGEVNGKITVLAEKVEGITDKVEGIEEARRLSAALAKQGRSDAVEANAVAMQHALSYNQRVAIMVAAVSGIGALCLGILNFVAGH